MPRYQRRHSSSVSYPNYVAGGITRKSISGTAFGLNGKWISWSCKKKHSAALWTIEEESVAASKACEK